MWCVGELSPVVDEQRREVAGEEAANEQGPTHRVSVGDNMAKDTPVNGDRAVDGGGGGGETEKQRSGGDSGSRGQTDRQQQSEPSGTAAAGGGAGAGTGGGAGGGDDRKDDESESSRKKEQEDKDEEEEEEEDEEEEEEEEEEKEEEGGERGSVHGVTSTTPLLHTPHEKHFSSHSEPWDSDSSSDSPLPPPTHLLHSTLLSASPGHLFTPSHLRYLTLTNVKSEEGVEQGDGGKTAAERESSATVTPKSHDPRPESHDQSCDHSDPTARLRKLFIFHVQLNLSSTNTVTKYSGIPSRYQNTYNYC